MGLFYKIAKIFLISMVPIIELRGALPVAFFDCNLPIWLCYILSIAGNLIPVPFLLFFGMKVLNYFATLKKFGKPFRKIIEIGTKKAAKIDEKKLFWGIMAFVAIPLPGTGAWTGCLISMILGLPFKKSFAPIALGVAVSGIIVSAVVLLIDGGIEWLEFLI